MGRSVRESARWVNGLAAICQRPVSDPRKPFISLPLADRVCLAKLELINSSHKSYDVELCIRARLPAVPKRLLLLPALAPVSAAKAVVLGRRRGTNGSRPLIQI